MKPPAPVTQMRSFWLGQYGSAPYTVSTARPAAAISFLNATGDALGEARVRAC